MNAESATCCARCKGAFEICKHHGCDCHISAAERNVDHNTRNYDDPTADAAIRNLALNESWTA